MKTADCRPCGHCNALPDGAPADAVYNCGACGALLDPRANLACETCRHYAWSPEMGGPVWDAHGRPHHPSCAVVAGGTMGDTPPAAPGSSMPGVALVGLLLVGGLGLAWLLGAFGGHGGALSGWASDSSSSYRGWDKRRERDEFAQQNIPRGALPLWRRIGGQFRGTPHERSEAFLEYIEEHPGEVAAAQQDEADAQLEAMIGQEEHRSCRCVDGDEPRCCGRGCCSHHRGIRGPAGRRDERDEVPF